MSDDLVGSMLKEFISSFEASLDPRLWLKLVEEEQAELEEALESESAVDILKEMTDLMYVTVGFNHVSVGAEQLGLFSAREHESILEALTSSSQTYEKAIDFLPEETQFYEAFRRVHLSNMSKLGEDGKPIKREDGKVLKGPNYVKPNLEDLV